MGKGERRRMARVEQALRFPAGVLTNDLRLELVGRRQAVLEGCRRILAYESDCICVSTADGPVRFTGRNLCLQRLTAGSAVITGTIRSVEYR